MKNYLFLLIAICFLFAGCRTTQPVARPSAQELDEQIKSVAEAVSGQDVTPEDVQRLKKDLRTDKETQSAVKAIGEALQGEQRVKYSPATGKRYSADLEYDPETGVKLEYVE